MAHFAKLDENNTVIDVQVVMNNDIIDDNGQESEQKGITLLKSLFGQNTRWVQTSYNNNFRKRYACIGGKYSEEYDAFLPPPNFNSWVFNVETLDYEAPKPKPNDGKYYVWREDILDWVDYHTISPN
jgi:hypothetical protein